jgi:hypothetical protein
MCGIIGLLLANEEENVSLTGDVDAQRLVVVCLFDGDCEAHPDAVEH